MIWQTVIVFSLIGVAAVYVGRRTWKTWSGKASGCSGGCHCDQPADSKEFESNGAIPLPQIQEAPANSK